MSRSPNTCARLTRTTIESPSMPSSPPFAAERIDSSRSSVPMYGPSPIDRAGFPRSRRNSENAGPLARRVRAGPEHLEIELELVVRRIGEQARAMPVFGASSCQCRLASAYLSVVPSSVGAAGADSVESAPVSGVRFRRAGVDADPAASGAGGGAGCWRDLRDREHGRDNNCEQRAISSTTSFGASAGSRAHRDPRRAASSSRRSPARHPRARASETSSAKPAAVA